MCHKYHQFMMYYFPYFVSVLFPFVSVACTCSSNKLKNSVCVLSIFCCCKVGANELVYTADGVLI